MSSLVQECSLQWIFQIAAQNKTRSPIYDSKNMQQQLGFISVITRFANNFFGKIQKEQNKFSSPLKFTKPVIIEGNRITKSDVQERQTSFEERMKNLTEKYKIEPSKKDTAKFMDIDISQDIYKAIHQGMVLIGKNRSEHPNKRARIVSLQLLRLSIQGVKQSLASIQNIQNQSEYKYRIYFI
ncbi:hypothetical protein ABPG72_000315 [Tetrahymena utriculariae]